MRGYQLVPTLLRQRGLTTVFAMLAETNGPWLGYGIAHGLVRLVRTRHEETAVMAANGFARVTGSPGVASVTRGPGFANSINALAAAVDTHVPLILFTGESPRPTAQSQNLEQEGIARLLGAGYVAVHEVAELPDVLDRAIDRATWRGWPQVVAVPEPLLGEEAEPGEWVPVPPAPAVPNAAAVAKAVTLLTAAKHPLIIGGHGAVGAAARTALERLAEHTGAALGTTLMAIRNFAGHPNEIGLVGGWAPRAAREYLQSVDLVVAFGATLNRFTMDRGRLFPEASVVQVLLDANDAGSFRRPNVLLVGDAAETASAVLAELDRRGMPQRAYPGPSFASVRESLLAVERGRAAAGGLDVIAVGHRIDELLPPDRIVVTDSGRAVIPLPDLVDARDGRSWIHGRGYGSIGQGLGLAIGAATAQPGRTTVLFVGDGAFLSACHDLDAARLAGLENLVIVVLNDEKYGMEVGAMTRFGLSLEAISQSTPELVALARVYGGDGVRIESVADLDALRIPIGQGLFLVDARLDAESDPAFAVGDGSGAK